MFKNLSKNKYHFNYYQRGMTLIELLVVIAIFTVISSMIMFNYGDFRSTASTQNLANDIALSIRKAQSSAIGVVGVNSNFQYAHGIHFTTKPNQLNSTSGSDKSFVLFTDLNSNGTYDSGNSPCGSFQSGNECKEILKINGNDKISSFSLDGATSQKGTLDIVFKRPNPDAIFCFMSGYNNFGCSSASYVTITIINNQNVNKIISQKITVWNTGQISVQ